jgi:hypothetical protein
MEWIVATVVAGAALALLAAWLLGFGSRRRAGAARAGAGEGAERTAESLRDLGDLIRRGR